MDTTAIASRRTASVAVRLRRSVYPYVWISPALLVFGVFTLLPLAAGVALSLVTWDGIHAVRWEGLGNYVQVLQDQAFWQALVHNVIYALGTVVGAYQRRIHDTPPVAEPDWRNRRASL